MCFNNCKFDFCTKSIVWGRLRNLTWCCLQLNLDGLHALSIILNVSEIGQKILLIVPRRQKKHQKNWIFPDRHGGAGIQGVCQRNGGLHSELFGKYPRKVREIFCFWEIIQSFSWFIELRRKIPLSINKEFTWDLLGNFNSILYIFFSYLAVYKHLHKKTCYSRDLPCVSRCFFNTSCATWVVFTSSLSTFHVPGDLFSRQNFPTFVWTSDQLIHDHRAFFLNFYFFNMFNKFIAVISE